MEVYLIPELVKLTGMTDRERNNFKTMQNVAEFTKLFPSTRDDMQNQLVNKLRQKMITDGNCPLSIGEQSHVNAAIYKNPQI